MSLELAAKFMYMTDRVDLVLPQSNSSRGIISVFFCFALVPQYGRWGMLS